MSLKEYDELAVRSGHDLAGAGVNGHAFERPAALAAIEVLARYGVPILGGDVYSQTAQGLELTYDNWYADAEAGEPRADYAARAALVSRAFVEAYPEPPGATTLYRLVFRDE